MIRALEHNLKQAGLVLCSGSSLGGDMSQIVIYAKDILCGLLEGDESTLEFVGEHTASGCPQMLVADALAWALQRAQPAPEGVTATAKLLWRAELSPIKRPRAGQQDALLTSDLMWLLAHGAELDMLRGMTEKVDLLVNIRSLSLALFACQDTSVLDLQNLGQGLEEVFHLVDHALPPVDEVSGSVPSVDEVRAVIGRAIESAGLDG